MAAVKRARTAQATRPTKQQGKCIDCSHGYVMKDDMPCNPLITRCDIDGERYPQSWECHKDSFSERVGELVIHPMIHLNGGQDAADNEETTAGAGEPPRTNN